jgi:hypothetical protein
MKEMITEMAQIMHRNGSSKDDLNHEQPGTSGILSRKECLAAPVCNLLSRHESTCLDKPIMITYNIISLIIKE